VSSWGGCGRGSRVVVICGLVICSLGARAWSLEQCAPAMRGLWVGRKWWKGEGQRRAGGWEELEWGLNG
jgi:hypothetical protein